MQDSSLLKERVASPAETFRKMLLNTFQTALAARTPNPNRDTLVFVPLNGLQIARTYEDIDRSKSCIDEQILILHNMLSSVLEHDDFELFRAIVDYVSKFLMIGDLSSVASELEDMTYVDLAASLTSHRREAEQIRSVVRIGSAVRFERIFEIPEPMSQLSIREKRNEVLKEARQLATSFYTNALLNKVFFLASATVLFEHRDRKSDAISYLSVLWHHTSPEDADGTWLNLTPVFRDPFRLTVFYLYGGLGNPFWSEGYRFRDFHGTSRYVTQSYLLGLAKLGKTLAVPTATELKVMADNELWDVLGELYKIAEGFLNETGSERFKNELNGISELQLDSFITRSRPQTEGQSWHDQLQKAIEEARARFSDAKEMIEACLPLDANKKATCISTISDAYQAESVVGKAASLIPCKGDLELERLNTFSNRFPPFPKHCFIGPANVDCKMIWAQLGEDIALQETLHIVNEASRVAPLITVEKYDPDLIYENVMKATRGLTGPNLAFVPLDLETEWQKRMRIRHDLGPFLPLPNGRLDLVHSWRGLPFADVFVLDRHACQWLYEDFDGGRLMLTIQPSVDRVNTVRVQAQSRGVLAFRQGGIRVIKLLGGPSGSNSAT